VINFACSAQVELRDCKVTCAHARVHVSVFIGCGYRVRVVAFARVCNISILSCVNLNAQTSDVDGTVLTAEHACRAPAGAWIAHATIVPNNCYSPDSSSIQFVTIS